MSNSLARKITAGSLMQFTLPSIIMMAVMSVYTIIDGIFVARLVGTNAFSAVNIIYPVLSVVIALGTMFGTGLTAIVSRKIGEGKKQEARENMTFIIVFTILLAVGIAVLAFIFLEQIIYGLGANKDIYDYCYDYAFPLIFFLPANILQLQFQCLFVANGKPNIGLAVTVFGGIANVILDYLFIAVLGMGIAGAAVATGISYSIPALFGLGYFILNRKGMLYFSRLKADWRVLLSSAVNGSSEMVSNLSGSITTYLYNIIMMHFIGPDGVAAISVLLYLDFVLIAVSLGYAMGVAPLISFNFGCGETEKLKKIYRISTRFSLLLGVTVTVLTIASARILSGVFAEEGSFVYEMAYTGLRIFAFGYIFKGYNIFASAMFTAFSNGKVSAVLSFVRTLVFLVIALLGLAALFGVDGVWYATPVAELLALIVSVYCLKKYRTVYHYK